MTPEVELTAEQILFEDNHCLAVAKPAPLMTQAPPGVPSLERMAKAYLKRKYNKPGNVYLGVPHRLDRPVTGVVLFARNSKAAARLAEQFEKRTVRKIYWAWLEGVAEPAAGIWEDWMLKRPDEARSECCTADTAGAKQAILAYRTLAIVDGGSVLELEPKTGRMHQIRVQTGSRGWPVRGDEGYGATQRFGPEVTQSRDRIIALHARALTILHPLSYQPMTLSTPLPPTWNARIRELAE
jgi:23S rRNA pseudouridine1911/1915/1917 synthase